MATVTVYTTAQNGFKNNISGDYPNESWPPSVLASSTSSSNSVWNIAYWFFNVPAARTWLAGDTITAATFRAYCSAYSDVNGVATWNVYRDVNQVWGTTLATATFSPDFGTVWEANVSSFTVSAWYELSCNLSTYNIDKTKYTNIGINPALGDLGPANANFNSLADGSNYAELVITYTPAGSGTSVFNKIRGMLGKFFPSVGKPGSGFGHSESKGRLG